MAQPNYKQNKEYELQYKSHNQFFDTFDKRTDYVCDIFVRISREYILMPELFGAINSLILKYGGYVRDQEKLNKELEKVRKVIFGSRYIVGSNEKRKRPEFEKLHSQCVIDLENIFKTFCKDCANSELMPKPHAVEDDSEKYAWMKIKHEGRKSTMKAFDDLAFN